MAGPKDEATALDIGAILDRALESKTPRVRHPTKTQQLREQRLKIVALRAKGYTLGEIATMVGVSKDTLRQAIREPLAIPKMKSVTTKKTKSRRKKSFPDGDDL